MSNSAAAILLDGTLPVLLFGAGVTAVHLAPEGSAVTAALQWVWVVLTLLAPALYGSAFLLRRRVRSSAAADAG